jgi:PAS domain S-box-containing protein
LVERDGVPQYPSSRAMHQLRVSEIKPVILQNMLENLPVGLMVIDANGEIITINRAASEILGYSIGVFEGKGWADLFFEGPKNRDFNQIIIDIIWDKKVNLRRQVPYIRSDGKTLQLSITGSFLREENGIAGIVVLMNDVTELHQAHENEKAVLAWIPTDYSFPNNESDKSGSQAVFWPNKCYAYYEPMDVKPIY